MQHYNAANNECTVVMQIHGMKHSFLSLTLLQSKIKFTYFILAIITTTMLLTHPNSAATQHITPYDVLKQQKSLKGSNVAKLHTETHAPRGTP